MKRLVVVGIVGLSLLTGCTAQPAPKATPSALALAPLTEAQYIEVMHKIPGFETTDDSLLTRMGPQQCAELKQTENWNDAVTASLVGSTRTTSAENDALTASVRTYCPGLIALAPTK